MKKVLCESCVTVSVSFELHNLCNSCKWYWDMAVSGDNLPVFAFIFWLEISCEGDEEYR
jgi:hypothetical protein